MKIFKVFGRPKNVLVSRPANENAKTIHLQEQVNLPKVTGIKVKVKRTTTYTIRRAVLAGIALGVVTLIIWQPWRKSVEVEPTREKVLVVVMTATPSPVAEEVKASPSPNVILASPTVPSPTPSAPDCLGLEATEARVFVNGKDEIHIVANGCKGVIIEWNGTEHSDLQWEYHKTDNMFGSPKLNGSVWQTVIEPGDYFITSLSNKEFLPSDKKNPQYARINHELGSKKKIQLNHCENGWCTFYVH